MKPIVADETTPLLSSDNSRQESSLPDSQQQHEHEHHSTLATQPNLPSLFYFRLKLFLGVSIVFLLAWFIFYLRILPRHIQQGANEDGLIINRLVIHNWTNEGLYYSLDASRPASAAVAPIQVAKQPSYFSIYAKRPQSTYDWCLRCHLDWLRPLTYLDPQQDPSIVQEGPSLMKFFGQSLGTWEQQEQAHPDWLEHERIAQVLIPTVQIKAFENSFHFDGFINMTRINLYWMTSLLQNVLIQRNETAPIQLRVQSMPYFVLDYLGSFFVPMWSFQSMRFDQPINVSSAQVSKMAECKELFSCVFNINITTQVNVPLDVSGLGFQPIFNVFYDRIKMAQIHLHSLSIQNSVLKCRISGKTFAEKIENIPVISKFLGELAQGNATIQVTRNDLVYDFDTPIFPPDKPPIVTSRIFLLEKFFKYVSLSIRLTDQDWKLVVGDDD